MQKKNSSLLLFAIDTPDSFSHVQLSTSLLTVGRDTENDVVVNDPYVSRHHFQLAYLSERWHISCLPGAGLLFINGHQTDESDLMDGDQIVIGGTVLRLSENTASPDLVRTMNVIDSVPELQVQCGTLRFSVPLRGSHITIGRDPQSNIILPSPLVSNKHAVLQSQPDGSFLISDANSVNGLRLGGKRIQQHLLQPHDVIVIGTSSSDRQIKLTFSNSSPAIQNVLLNTYATGDIITFGRDLNCTIPLSSPLISRKHANIYRDAKHAVIIEDMNSTNGTFVNEMRINRPTLLHVGDEVQIGPFKYIFTGEQLDAQQVYAGSRIDAIELVRSATNRKQVLLDHVTLTILPGEFIAVAGPTGAGKSTFMKALAGIQRAQSGKVLIDHIDSYEHDAYFRGRIGYLPQANIAHDTLTVEHALYYTARLRLASDMSEDEIADQIMKVLITVSLSHRRSSPIGSLSGGEKRRLNLAQELLAEPPILFLDEPGAGLDPDMQRDLIRMFRSIADQGQTVILVTHEKDDLALCDRIVFTGFGGKLCYTGSPSDIYAFFEVTEIEDIYALVKTEQGSLKWQQRFSQSSLYSREVTDRLRPQSAAMNIPYTRPSLYNKSPTTHRISSWAQTMLLVQRYTETLRRDPRNLTVLLLQAPAIALVLALVSASNVFNQTKGPFDAQKVLFFLVVAAIWFGTINAVREISKENDIYLRERLAGLGIWPYLLSKIIVLTILCAIQTFVLVAIVVVHTGLPPDSAGLFFAPFVELLIGVFLAGFAGLAMGLCVSSFATTQELAISIAPLILIPQLLLAGVTFSIQGGAQVPADFMISRWAVQALGTSANLDHIYFEQLVLQNPGTIPDSLIAGQDGFLTTDYDSNPLLAHYAFQGIPNLSWANAVDSRRSHLLLCWGVIGMLSIAFIFITAARQRAKDPS